MEAIDLHKTIQLTTEQDAVADVIYDHYYDALKGVIVVQGRAGTGKTTLLASISTDLDVPVLTPTNRAAAVLLGKGVPRAMTVYRALLEPVFAEAYRALEAWLETASATGGGQYDTKYMTKFWPEEILYQMLAEGIAEPGNVWGNGTPVSIVNALRVIKKTPEDFIESWTMKSSGAIRGPIALVDEASMLSQERLEDLRARFDLVVLFGDVNQLPPVDKRDKTVCSMKSDMVTKRLELHEIHRQAKNSPIIRLAHEISDGGELDVMGLPDHGPVRSGRIKLAEIADTPIVVFKNDVREKINRDIRIARGFTDLQVGEPLVCRDNVYDNHKVIIPRNARLTVTKVETSRIVVVDELGVEHSLNAYFEEYDNTRITGSGAYDVTVRFGYAATCHSLQGSEFKRVYIHLGQYKSYRRFQPGSWRNWLYTAITRAANEVVFIRNPGRFE